MKRLAKRIEESAFRAHEIMQELRLPVHGCPAGGFYMWCELPADVGDTKLSREAAERGILLAPGSVFYPDYDVHRPAMRVNVAYVDDPRFKRFMEDVLGQARQ